MCDIGKSLNLVDLYARILLINIKRYWFFFTFWVLMLSLTHFSLMFYLPLQRTCVGNFN